LPHLPISKTQNQISYMRGELVELGKSDTVPEISAEKIRVPFSLPVFFLSPVKSQERT
jgi:hypothetical protein